MENEKNGLLNLVKPNSVIDKDGIWVTKEIADQTVWDNLAIENPTNAAISAVDEEDAAKKSVAQIEDITSHVGAEDIVLDCGAGYGRVAKYLLPKIVLRSYVGVDSSYEMLSLFRNRYHASDEESRTPLLLLNADMHTLPLCDASVDKVLVSAVFLHNHKSVVEQAMREISRVLKPGGTILVYSSFPRGMTLMGLQGYAYQMFLNLLGKPFKNGPVRYYRKSEVARLFKAFSIVEIKLVGFAVLPKTIIFLSGPIERFWRVKIANKANAALEKIMPISFKQYFAVHFDVVAKR